MDFDLLRRLIEAPGIPGREEAVRAIVHGCLSELCTEISIDRLGNLTARLAGAGPRLVLDAHMDEVGLMVQHVDEAGFLRVVTVGGLDPRVLYGQPVIVWGVETLPGVIGAIPPHLLGKDESQKDRVVPIEDLFVDLGLPAAEVADLVRVGDPVTFAVNWVENRSSVQAKALDDRVGLFVMMEALQQVSRPRCDLYVVASVQEEAGLRGVGPVARRIDPDLVVALEGTVANDLPGVPPQRVFARLGHGPEIRLSDGRFLADRTWSAFIVDLCREAAIPHQVVVKKVGGTNAAALQVEGTGARAAALSVPVRYIHAPVGIAWKADIEAAVSLTARLLEEVDRFAFEA
jgi:putative aminopeptidase FrvX